VSQSRRHLIIQTAFLGDLLLGIPFFKALRATMPNDQIVLFCRKGLGGFLVDCGLVDELIEVDKTDSTSRNQAKIALKGQKFDLLFCPHQSFRSAWLAARVQARQKIGYSRFFNRWFFDQRILRPKDLPEALRQLALLVPIQDQWSERLARFAADQVAPGGQGPGGELLAVPDWADMTVNQLMQLRGAFQKWRVSRTNSPHTDSTTDSHLISFLSSLASPKVLALCHHYELGTAPIACLAPGSVWPTKMWTVEGFAETARILIADGYRVLLIGAPNEKVICSEVASRAPGAISIAGETSLFESAQVLALADLAICNDSGAMHMSAAAGVSTVAIFGPTILEFGYRPWQTNARVVEINKEELQCRPCGKHGAKKCPIGTHECMTRISASDVWKATSALRP
jgi:heptosyltransferase-2